MNKFLDSLPDLILPCWVQLKANKATELNSMTIAIAKLSTIVSRLGGEKIDISDFLPETPEKKQAQLSEQTCEIFWEFIEQANPDKYVALALSNGILKELEKVQD